MSVLPTCHMRSRLPCCECPQCLLRLSIVSCPCMQWEGRECRDALPREGLSRDVYMCHGFCPCSLHLLHQEHPERKE